MYVPVFSILLLKEWKLQNRGKQREKYNMNTRCFIWWYLENVCECKIKKNIFFHLEMERRISACGFPIPASFFVSITNHTTQFVD